MRALLSCVPRVPHVPHASSPPIAPRSHVLLTHQRAALRSMDVAYSPTGKEFVTGSYDRTIRIFPVQSGKSREVYHTKRMQRCAAVRAAPSRFR